MAADTYTGSVCIMLTDSATYDGPRGWQRELQAELGGRCETPLHLTIDRTYPVAPDTVPALVDALRTAFRGLAPLTLQATHLHAARSSYRSSWILKADAVLSPEIADLRAAVRSACERAGTRCVYPVDLDREFVALTALVEMPGPAAADVPDRRDGSRSPAAPASTPQRTPAAPADARETNGTPRKPLAQAVSITLSTVHISRIAGPFEYEEVARWGLGVHAGG